MYVWKEYTLVVNACICAWKEYTCIVDSCMCEKNTAAHVCMCEKNTRSSWFHICMREKNTHLLWMYVCMCQNDTRVSWIHVSIRACICHITGAALFYEGLAVCFWEVSRFSRFIRAVIRHSMQLHGMWSWRVHLLSSACVYIIFYPFQSYWQLEVILTEFCGPNSSLVSCNKPSYPECVCAVILVWVDSSIPHSYAVWRIFPRVLSCHTSYGLGAYKQTVPMKIQWSTDKIQQCYAACALFVHVCMSTTCITPGLCSIKLNMCVPWRKLQGFDCILKCTAFQFGRCQEDACFICLLMRFEDAETLIVSSSCNPFAWLLLFLGLSFSHVFDSNLANCNSAWLNVTTRFRHACIRKES